VTWCRIQKTVPSSAAKDNTRRRTHHGKAAVLQLRQLVARVPGATHHTSSLTTRNLGGTEQSPSLFRHCGT
jgi:hypothetical protein